MLKKIVSYSAGLYFISLLTSIARVMIKSLVAKTIGKEALGAYAFYMTILMLASSVLSFGLRRAITKYVASSSSGGEDSFAPLVATVIAVGTLASLLLAGIGLLLSQWIDGLYVLALLSVGAFTLFEIARSSLRGQLDQKREMILVFVGIVVQTLFIALLVIFRKDPLAPVIGLTIANIVIAIGIVIYFSKRFQQWWRPSLLWQSLRSKQFHALILLAAPLWVTDILGILGNQADQLIVQGQLGFAVLAEYAAAFTFIGLMDQPITVMSRVFLVTFSGGHYNDFKQYKRISSLNLAFFSVVGLLLVVVTPPLTPILFTNAFTMVPLLVAILSVSTVFNSVEVLNTSLTIAIDYPQANRDSKIIAILFYLPVMFALVYRFGVVGAAISNVLSWAAYALLHAYFMRKRLPEHAAFTFHQMFKGVSLYIVVVACIWFSHNVWLTLLMVPVYLATGQWIGLWNLKEIGILIQPFLPKQLSLKLAAIGGSVGLKK